MMISMPRVLFIALLASLLAAPAEAALKVNAERIGNFSFGTAFGIPVPLNNSGATSLTFSGSGKFTIIYSAECAVDAPAGNTRGWLTIAIVVDGVEIGQSAGPGDIFCTANGTVGIDGWTMASMLVVTPSLAVGTHTIQVKAEVASNFGATGGWLGDSGLAVMK